MKSFYEHELQRLDMCNEPVPDKCPKCKGVLADSKGMVGEGVLYCPNKKCDQGIVWEDSEGALSIII